MSDTKGAVSSIVLLPAAPVVVPVAPAWLTALPSAAAAAAAPLMSSRVS